MLRIAAATIVVAALVYVIPVALTSAVQPGCASCHDARGLISTVSAPEHASQNIPCATCHIEDSLFGKARFAHYQVWGMYVPLVTVKGTTASLVTDGSCTACHDDLSGVQQSSGLRIKHDECAVGSACVDCHSLVAHGDEVSWPNTYHMDRCLSCHSAKTAASTCDTCHVGGVTDARPSTGPWAITHGPNWRTTHGMGDMGTCGACHEPSKCESCHGAGVPHDRLFYDQHGVYAKSEAARCADCHTDQSFCSDCHQIEMPHPKDFVIGHAKIVEEQGDSDCMRCHLEDDCINCHVKHVHPGGAVSLEPVGGA